MSFAILTLQYRDSKEFSQIVYDPHKYTPEKLKELEAMPGVEKASLRRWNK